MTENDKPLANPVVVLREEFDDWAVLFNPDTGSAVGINPTGVAVWKLMDGRRSLDDIVAAIREQFDQVSETASDEVRKFVSELAQGGFVGYELAEAG